MNKLKYIAFGLLFIIMWLPLIQMLSGFIATKSLKGSFAVHTKPILNDSSWFEGAYQKGYEEFLNDTIGFHQDLIRLRNQIDYSLFKKCHSYDIEVGKNGYLIATSHIDYYLGKVHTEEAIIDSTIKMLKQINDTLLKMNKTLIVLFAPNRGPYYKEFAPSWYDQTKVHESDHECYTRLLANTKIRTLDCYKWFLEEKQRTKYALFTKCGIHWSVYGAALASDSLVGFIEKERNIDLPDITFTDIEQTTTARNDDDDLNNAINLIWRVPNGVMAYPKIEFSKTGKDKTKVLFVSDSFFFNMGASHIPEEAFEEYSLWYYNKTIFSNNKQKSGKSVTDVDLKDEVDRNDVIVIMATEINLEDLGWGFIQNMWQLYCGNGSNRLDFYINKIKNDAKWFMQVKQKAIERNKELDVQLAEDAAYAVDLEKQQLRQK